MGELQSIARLKIHDGKLDEFKRLAAKCAELDSLECADLSALWPVATCRDHRIVECV